MKRTLMAGPVWLSYGQIHVQSSDESAELGQLFAGQQNGLCGAAVAGTLCLMTGLHTGEVDFAAELYEAAPPIDESWEDIVEASYRPDRAPTLMGLMGEVSCTLDLELVDYRVRYCGRDMDAGDQASPPMDGEPLVDHYLLQFWPAPPAPDRVVKQTSRHAAYWHEFARKQPTPAGFAELKREREREAAERRLAEQAEAWGGALPTDQLRSIHHSQELAYVDRPLVDELMRTDPEVLRAIARWVARRACTEAGYDGNERIAGILDRMDQGADWFETLNGPVQLPEPGTEAVQLFVSRQYGWDDRLDPYDNTLSVVTAALNQDPLQAAIEAITLGLGPFADPRQLLGEVRQRFLRSPGL
jgi:hypothetical protein